MILIWKYKYCILEIELHNFCEFFSAAIYIICYVLGLLTLLEVVNIIMCVKLLYFKLLLGKMS